MGLMLVCVFGSLISIMFLYEVMLNEQDAQPRTVIALWKADLEEPKLHQSDPSVIIVDKLASNYLILSADSGLFSL